MKYLLAHKRRKLYKYLNCAITEDLLLEVQLLVLAFATGINDASTYSEYRVFTSNHTGNTILLAVGATENATGAPKNYPTPLQFIGVSLAFFLIGALIPGQLGHIFGCRRRWWLLVNNIIQTILVFVSSGIQADDKGGWNRSPERTDPHIIGNYTVDYISNYTSGIGDLATIVSGATHGVVPNINQLIMQAANNATSQLFIFAEISINWHPLVVIAFLAFSAGGQVCMARSLQMTEITTANATSTYVDILIDMDMFRLHNRRRNRRILFLVSLTAGSFTGGGLYQTLGSSTTLFISGIFKALMTITLLINRGISEDDDSSLMIDDKECPLYSSYEGLNSYPRIPEMATLVHRDDIPRYILREYMEFNYRHLAEQVPSWVMNAGVYIKRHLPGIALANTYRDGHIGGFQ